MPMPSLRLTPLGLTPLAAVLLPLLLAGCDAAGLKLPGFGDRSPDAAAPAPSGPPAVSPLEVPIETGAAARPVGTANRETVGVAAFAASGADWSAVVDGKAAALTRSGARPVRIAVRRIDFDGGVEFVGALGGQAFALTVRAADCAGSAPMSASLRYSGRTATGCAAPATAEQVATIAAAAPAPAPAPKRAAPKPAPAKPAAPAAPAAAPAPAEQTPAEPSATDTPAVAPATSGTTTTPEPTTPDTTAPGTPAAAAPAATAPTPTAPASTAPATTGQPAPASPAPATGTTPPIVIPGGPTTLPGAPALTTTPPPASE